MNITIRGNGHAQLNWTTLAHKIWILFDVPDGSASSGDHDDNGRAGGEGGWIVDIKHKATTAVGRVYWACDEHTHKVHVILILK